MSNFYDKIIGDFKQVTGNLLTFYGLSANNICFSSGNNNYGQLLQGPYVGSSSGLYPISGQWSKISAGGFHVFLKNLNDKKWYSGGSNGAGQLGQGFMGGSYSVATVLPNNYDSWDDVQCGEDFTVALLGDKLYVTGNNSYGQLGLGQFTGMPGSGPSSISTFTQVPGKWSMLGSLNGGGAVRSTWALSANSDYTWFATGNNENGQFGLGDKTRRYTMTQIPGRWSNVIITYVCTFALSAGTNQWYVAGGGGQYNVGQTGLGGTPDGTTPWVPYALGNTYDKINFVPLPGKFNKLIAGASTTFALSGNQWFCTGRNIEGQLGFNDNNNRYYFTPMSGNWADIVATGDSTFAFENNSDFYSRPSSVCLYSTGNLYETRDISSYLGPYDYYTYHSAYSSLSGIWINRNNLNLAIYYDAKYPGWFITDKACCTCFYNENVTNKITPPETGWVISPSANDISCYFKNNYFGVAQSICPTPTPTPSMHPDVYLTSTYNYSQTGINVAIASNVYQYNDTTNQNWLTSYGSTIIVPNIYSTYNSLSVLVTPTPTVTPSITPTNTPTPTITPTATPTPTPTPNDTFVAFFNAYYQNTYNNILTANNNSITPPMYNIINSDMVLIGKKYDN